MYTNNYKLEMNNTTLTWRDFTDISRVSIGTKTNRISFQYLAQTAIQTWGWIAQVSYRWIQLKHQHNGIQ